MPNQRNFIQVAAIARIAELAQRIDTTRRTQKGSVCLECAPFRRTGASMLMAREGNWPVQK
jgi:hypothetical protein